jgi:hypothetical protein
VVHERQRSREGAEQHEDDRHPCCRAAVGRPDVPPSDGGGAHCEDQYRGEPRHVPRVR